MATDDGGPAFPDVRRLEMVHAIGLPDETKEMIYADCKGMSVRAYFAGQALQGLASRLTSERFDLIYGGIQAGGKEAKVAACLADALIAELKK